MESFFEPVPARLCAHRGMNLKAPENTLPAFALAIAHGAKEIELDLWPAKDGTLMVCHDPTVNRTTDGEGYIAALDYAALRKLDAGVKFSPDFKNIRLPLFEEVLEQFGKRAVINLHIKSAGQTPVDSPEMRLRGRQLSRVYQENTPCYPPLSEGVEHVLPEVENRAVAPYSKQVFDSILKLLDRYGCMDKVYFTGEKDVLITAMELAPNVPRCCLEGHMNYSIVENAIAYGCRRVQFCKTLLTQRMISKAKACGLHCNLFWSDDPGEALAYIDLGIDTLLTNAFDLLAGGGMLRKECNESEP